MFFMLNDNMKDKIDFIFKMISTDGMKISNSDLRKFYKMINFEPVFNKIEKK